MASMRTDSENSDWISISESFGATLGSIDECLAYVHAEAKSKGMASFTFRFPDHLIPLLPTLVKSAEGLEVGEDSEKLTKDAQCGEFVVCPERKTRRSVLMRVSGAVVAASAAVLLGFGKPRKASASCSCYSYYWGSCYCCCLDC
jgi:hypothetical protein